MQRPARQSYLHFYPRSPCGERLQDLLTVDDHSKISIHALLAESDLFLSVSRASAAAFLSTLSLRRATCVPAGSCCAAGISIHALLAESDRPAWISSTKHSISIHALLAESDTLPRWFCGQNGWHFYPRSPCGERLFHFRCFPFSITFLSTLSLRRATAPAARGGSPTGISIHALLAESDYNCTVYAIAGKNISIHALLAESDVMRMLSICSHRDFYPRSPCGERLVGTNAAWLYYDFYPRSPCGERPSRFMLCRAHPLHFYPRSPCGERRLTPSRSSSPPTNFYPRSPCGERPSLQS